MMIFIRSICLSLKYVLLGLKAISGYIVTRMQYRQQGEGVELIGRNVRHGYNNIDPEAAG